jgi:hypothetical protein
VLHPGNIMRRTNFTRAVCRDAIKIAKNKILAIPSV